jgi:tetratricopeptide (TPR) repeat protein
MKKQLPLILIAFFFTACTTASKVVVRSEPIDAKVYLVDTNSGQNALIGNTPLAFDREAKTQAGKDVLQLRIEKEGFEPRYAAVASFGGETTFVDVKLNSVSVANEDIRKSFELSRSLLVEANRLVVAKRFSEALTRTEKILEMDPKNAEAHAAKGSILFLMKDLDGAKQSWTRSLELNPSSEGVRASLIDLSLQDVGRQPTSNGGP